MSAANLTVRFVTAALLAIFFIAVLALIIARNLDARLSVILIDIQSYAFAATVLATLLFTSIGDRHIRVGMKNDKPQSHVANASREVLYYGLAVISFGTICILSIHEVSLAWQTLEGSSEPGGIGGQFLIKSFLPFCFGLLVLHGCWRITKYIKGF